MEFRTPSQFDPNGFNVQSLSLGGVGYNPTPPNFSYNGNGAGYYTSGSQPQGTSYVGSYNPGGYVTQTQPYNPYGGYTYNYNQGGPIFDPRVKLSEQFYYQLGYRPTVNDANGKPIQIGGSNSYSNYYSSAWDMYNQRKQQEQEWIDNQNQQRELRRQLTIMNRKFFGYDDGDEYFKMQEEQMQRMEAKRYEQNVLYQQYLAICQLQYLPNSSDPSYVNPATREYIDRWNRIYNERNSKYPDQYNMYDFFNGGIASDMYMDCIVDDALDHLKDMTRLYDQNNFRQQLAKSNPNYDPLTGTASGSLNLNNMSSPRLNIDDMEISLPPHLSNSEYAKKREKFMNTIFANSRGPSFTPPSQQNPNTGGVQNGPIPK